MTRWWALALICFVLIGCQRDKVVWDLTSLDAPAKRPGTRDPVTGKHRRVACTGDGSFEKARDCFLRAKIARFQLPLGVGTLTRDFPGREAMRLYVTSGPARGAWFVLNAPDGARWFFNRTAVRNPPTEIARVFELVSRFPNPPKKEGKPRLSGRDATTLTWEFTDAKSGERYIVKVKLPSGHLLELTAGEVHLRFG